MKKVLFFIAIIPNAEICAEVTQFKEYAAQHFNSSRALTSPPHITLIPPFRWEPKQTQYLEEVLKGFVHSQPSFYLGLENFDCFAPRVIFVKPKESKALATLQQVLKSTLEKQLNLSYRDHHGFHPHMTIAFKDLKAAIFPKAWAHYEQVEYIRYFKVEQLSLLQHNGERWLTRSNFPLIT